MANEIVALEQNGDDIGVLFLFPIGVPKQIAGANVVPTPSTNLPAVASAVLTAPEKAQLDAGTLAFTTMSFKRNGIAGAALLAHVQSVYADALTEFTANYNTRYSLAGNRYSA
jgi:hypothetical protein